MKHSKAAIPSGTHKRPLSLSAFARDAGLLTLGVTLAMLVTAVIQGNHKTWIIAAVPCPVTILVIWIATLTIGCLAMIPVGIWRLSKRLARQGVGKVTPQGQPWDRWIDGPEPLRP